MDYAELTVPENCFDSRKRSVDGPIIHHKRQNDLIVINLADATINQSIVTTINDTLLPPVMNVSLDSDRRDLCDSLNSDGLVNCTNGVNNIGNSTTPTVGAEIDNQVDNTAGTFNLTQLREQARSFPYVMTDLLTNRSDIMMLYEYVLPGRSVPNLNFLAEPTPSLTTSFVVPSATVTTASPTPTETGGSAAISYSLFITLAALLLANVL